jgi:hypothetical protein
LSKKKAPKVQEVADMEAVVPVAAADWGKGTDREAAPAFTVSTEATRTASQIRGEAEVDVIHSGKDRAED